MSSALIDTPSTPAQRIAKATTQVQLVLPDLHNSKLLEAVLVELAAELLTVDASFQAQVSARYTQLAAPSRRSNAKTSKAGTRARRATPKVSDFVETLVPIKHDYTRDIAIDGPLDPYYLLDVYGAHQLSRALGRHSLADLREAVALVQAKNPGTKPARKRTCNDLIEYIVATLAPNETSQLRVDD